MNDPNPDAPRYTQIGNWKHLVTDEREWLARPAAWGINQLPGSIRERKQLLYDYHYYPHFLGTIGCRPCELLVGEFFTEQGMRVPEVVPEDRAVCREWYNARHPNGQCQGWEFIRYANLYHRGVLTKLHLLNKCVDQLYELMIHRDSEQRSDTYRREWQKRERSLALELIGPNPFRPVTCDPSWQTSTTVALARQMYDAREFSAMPILADALQDVGCVSADVLDHCRGPGPHARGCWVVDLVLGLA